MDLSKINLSTTKSGFNKNFNTFSIEILNFVSIILALTENQLKQLKNGFDFNNLDSNDPVDQFRAWLSFLLENNLSKAPNAMSLATANKQAKSNNRSSIKTFVFRAGKPSNRTLILNNFDERGFKFYSRSKSQKGSDIELNPQGSICFFWESILRQVRITGPIHKISEEEMILDFSRESLESRLSIYLNNQELENLKNKEVLINLKQKFIFFFKYF